MGDVRFLQSRAGARIAFAAHGSGPPLVAVPPWASHLEADTGLSGYQAFHEALARRHTVVLYDRWGTGLSDRNRTDCSVGADVEVLADVVDHLKLRRFALLGPSHGGPVAATFARAQPRRVSHLVLYGNRASTLTSGPTWSAMRALMLANWPLAAQSIAAVACRGAGPADVDAFAEAMQASASPEMMIAFQEAALDEDVSRAFGDLRVPTLVLHRRHDALVSSEEASVVASRIPGARLEIVDDHAHVHYAGDVATLAERIVAFTAGGHGTPSAQLSPREAEVLELIAGGCKNAEVAERLVLSVRTVERHLLNAYTKLGVGGRSEAVSWWLRRGSVGAKPPT